MRWRYVLWGSLSYMLLSLVAFVAGLVLQNWLFPSARTAAAGWLLYFTPLIAIASLIVGALLSYLGYRVHAARGRFIVIFLLSLGYGVLISWGYWMVWLTMLVVTLVFYQLVRSLSRSASTR